MKQQLPSVIRPTRGPASVLGSTARVACLALICALFALPSGVALAQQTGTVQGTVIDNTGDVIPGANVVLQDTQFGAATSSDGTYSISGVAPGTYTVLATFIGFEQGQKEVTVEAGETVTVDFALTSGALELEGVAVTALGFREDRSQQAVASSQVSGDAIAESGETSALKGLSGKAAGVNITSSSGDPGAGARILIRGQTTISGDNEPLIVIDGVPVSNATEGSGVGGVVQQSRLNDLNPDDIASVEILKGAAAASLWGSRAQGGVVVIETKAGNAASQRVNVSFKSSISADVLNQEVPLQERFGHGTDGFYSFGSTGNSWGDRIATRSGGADNLITDPDAEGYLGVARGRQTGQLYYGIADGTLGNPHGGKNSRDTYNHAAGIFETGTTFDNSLSISGGGEAGSYYLSLSNTTQNGMTVGNSNYQRTSVRLNAERNVSDKLTVGAIANYIRINSDRVQQGSNISGLMLGSLRTSPDFDNADYTVDYYPGGLDGSFVAGRQRSYRNALGARANPIYDNPLWVANENTDVSLVNRILGKVNASYDVLDWFNVNGRVGVDTYTDRRQIFFPVYTAANDEGTLQERDLGRYEVTADLIGRASRQLTDNIGGSLLLGVQINHRETDDLGSDLNRFSNPVDLRSLTNAELTNISSFTGQSVRRTLGGFGELNLDLYDQLFFKATGRVDNASTFGPEANSTFFYPSAQLAWQFHKTLFPEGNNLLSFGKLFTNYAEVGAEPDPYLAFTYYNSEGFGDGFIDVTSALTPSAYGGGFQRNSRQASPAIIPERLKEFEIGADLRFFSDRFSLSGTFYDNRSSDLIFNVDVAPSTGFLTQTRNAAEFRNIGVELNTDAMWLETDNFSWNTYANWSTNENTVESLAGVTEFALAGFTSLTSSLVEGEPFGVLYGGQFVRDEDGSFALTEEGTSQGAGFPIDGPDAVIGDPNPDWRAGIGNTFRYKGLSLDMLVDIKHGGDVWNGTKGALSFFGRAEYQGAETTVSAEQASTLQNYVGCTLAELSQGACAGPYGETGSGTVMENGDGSYTFRGEVRDFGGGDVLVDEWYYKFGPGSGFTGPSEQFIEDGGFVRLRQVTLAYNWRDGLISRAGLSSVDFSFTGRNLLLFTDYTGVDPETNLTGPTNGQGLDYFNNPSTRSYQFTVRFNY